MVILLISQCQHVSIWAIGRRYRLTRGVSIRKFSSFSELSECSIVCTPPMPHQASTTTTAPTVSYVSETVTTATTPDVHHQEVSHHSKRQKLNTGHLSDMSVDETEETKRRREALMKKMKETTAGNLVEKTCVAEDTAKKVQVYLLSRMCMIFQISHIL